MLVEFLELLSGERPASVEEQRRLGFLLDHLALWSHGFEGAEMPSEGDPPEREDDHEGRRRRVSARFPALGLYRSLDLDLEGTPLVGDAIDDLVDIERDLREVQWYLENVGFEEAHDMFRWSYRHHWGDHLRQLQAYLNELGDGSTRLA